MYYTNIIIMRLFSTVQIFSIARINIQPNVIITMQIFTIPQTFTKCKYLLLPDKTIQTQKSFRFEISKIIEKLLKAHCNVWDNF